MSIADRTLDEIGDAVTSTVRRDYHWRESSELARSMLIRTALTFRDGKITVIQELPSERVER